jgi:hypothetical protein
MKRGKERERMEKQGDRSDNENKREILLSLVSISDSSSKNINLHHVSDIFPGK